MKTGTIVLKQSYIASFISRKKNAIVEIVSALFILLFVYTGINKLISVNSLQIVLREYPLIGSLNTVIAWGLPFVELFIALLLFIPKTKRAGLYGSLLLMTAFTLYLIYMLAFTPNKPCTCGGMLQKLTWPPHLVFNLLFIILAIWGIRLSSKKHIENG